MANLRADLYHFLAESFADPPQWLTLAGSEWPLYEIASALAINAQCLKRLANIPAESYSARLARYTSLFVGTGRPRFWLYESASLNRMLGPETFAVAKLYRAAGLETVGAELPDHISNELAFLAHLARLGQNEILPDEKKFIETHAGLWLPHLGRALAQSGDEVYAPIGQLLADWMEEIARQCGAHNVECGRTSVVHHSSFHIPKLPNIAQVAQCNLCGFCVQVCPTRALCVNESHSETALRLSASRCIGCGKCERVCETHALKVSDLPQNSSPSARITTLRQSPRVLCQQCGQPMISEAEFDFVTSQIGHPTWLDYCLECRSLIMERSQ